MTARAGLVTIAVILTGVVPSIAWAIQYDGMGNEAQGAGMAFAKIKNTKIDIVLLANDNPKGANTLRYKVGFDVDASGNVRGGWSQQYNDAGGVGDEAQGAGVAVADIDGNGRPDMLVMAYDNPSGANKFRIKVGRDLDVNGKATGWTGPFDTPGVGNEAQGAGMTLAKIDTNDKWDLILMAYDNPSGPNSFRYIVCMNITLANPTASCPATYTEVPGVGSEGQGAGVAIVDLDRSGGQEMVLMAYDRSGEFRYRVGANLDASGRASVWSAEQKLAGLGASSQGADVAFPILAGTTPTAVFMIYDNPSGPNSFRATYDASLPSHLSWNQLALPHIDGRVAFTSGVEATQAKYASPDWLNIGLAPIVSGMGALYVPDSMTGWLRDSVNSALLDGASIYLDAAGSVAGGALSEILGSALMGKDYLRWANDMLNVRVAQAQVDLKAAEYLQSTAKNAFVRLTRKTTELRGALEQERVARQANNRVAIKAALAQQLVILVGPTGYVFKEDRLLNGDTMPLVWEAANQEKQFRLQLDPKNYSEPERKAAQVKIDFVHRVMVGALQVEAITGWLKTIEDRLK